MAYIGKENSDDAIVPELKLRIEDTNDDYLKLPRCEDVDPEASNVLVREPSTPRIRYGFSCEWVKSLLLFTAIGIFGFAFFRWILPLLIDKVIPIINWEESTFSTPELAALLFVTVAIFPTLLLPSSPSMWAVGMTFGYGYGFLLIISARAIGVSLPYLIGSLLYHKIQVWLEKCPENASIIRLAGEGDWFHQFRAVVLIRLSPFPYILYNYCAVATDVKFGPYFLGSIIGIVPDVFISIYTGILIRTLAEASHRRHSLTAEQITIDILGFSAAATATVICTVFARKRLNRLQRAREPLLQ
ncbi:hypothetical protein Nepgr_030732 [Nepenthes gracilis]|uniref:VTT domain-containing protein n=1 Tax=Nepenthes gracilis TaxID=150966 RepID=A0AAD3Y6C4_NEPGR|nr:hypothetical protein Nepgr_030732 [Nepenthes gracilis]